MDNQAYETALESFSGVLETLSAGIKKLTKTPLDVPEIAKTMTIPESAKRYDSCSNRSPA